MFGQATYLVFELAWALPVLALQWLAGGAELWRLRRPLLGAVLLATAYLSLADTYAITHGIWRLNPRRVTGLALGPLPLEEALFFLVTNMMVVQGVALAVCGRPLQCFSYPRQLLGRIQASLRLPGREP
ncbi:MAG: lycopene cyclase domain-containing protein [Chloroflexota bacterium]